MGGTKVLSLSQMKYLFFFEENTNSKWINKNWLSSEIALQISEFCLWQLSEIETYYNLGWHSRLSVTISDDLLECRKQTNFHLSSKFSFLFFKWLLETRLSQRKLWKTIYFSKAITWKNSHTFLVVANWRARFTNLSSLFFCSVFTICANIIFGLSQSAFLLT